jgi:serine/threonine protein kinase
VLINFDSASQYSVDKITISDFGISRTSRIATDYGGAITVQGMLPYLAPEIRLLNTTQATKASDIWSVGCIAYEMCIGLRLSEGHVWEIDNYIHGRDLDLSRIPSRFGSYVRNVISVCLAKDPTRRIDTDSLQNLLSELVTRGGHVHQTWPPTTCDFLLKTSTD